MARLLVERGNEKGTSLELTGDAFTVIIGRSSSCELVLSDTLCSRRHFQIELTDGIYSVQDLDSHNGTYLNGKRVTAELMLQFGDTLRAGESLFGFIEKGSGDKGIYTGKRLANYDVNERLGVGGMGEVYKAIQRGLGRTVALKILHEDLVAEKEFVQRFLSEARAAGRLNHPNVIQVHDVGDAGGVYYISMEYVSGGSVHDLVRKGRRLPVERAAEIVLQAARALEYAEKQGIVHCDIKPDNLMLTEDGEVRLADLGIARRLTEGRPIEQEGGVFGSPHYMAPEQARGEPIDHRVDIYSLGVTFYRILSGKTPFVGRDAQEIMEKQVYEQPVPIRETVTEVSAGLAEIVETMMAKDREDRYQSAAEVVEDLEGLRDKAIDSAKTPARPMGPTTGRHARARARRSRVGSGGPVAVVIAALVLLAGTFVLMNRIDSGATSAEDLVRNAHRRLKKGNSKEAKRLLEQAIRRTGDPRQRARWRAEIDEIESSEFMRERKIAAQDALKQIEAYMADHSTETRRILDKLRRFRADYANSPLAQSVRPKITEYTARYNEEAEASFHKTLEEARELAQAHRYGKALRLWEEFQHAHPNTAAVDQVSPEREQIVRQAEADVKRIAARAARRIERGRYEEAPGLFDGFIGRAGIKTVVEQAKRAREKARRDARQARIQAREQARGRALDQAKQKLDEVSVAERGYRYAEAVSTLREADRLFRRAEKTAGVQDLDGRIAHLQRQAVLFDRLGKSIRKVELDSPVIRLGGQRSYRPVGATQRYLQLRAVDGRGPNRTISWRALRPEAMLALYRACKLNADEKVILGHFCFDQGLFEEAREVWQEAGRLHRGLKKDLEPLIAKAAAASPQERTRQDLADTQHRGKAVRALIAAGDLEQAEEDLTILQLRYGYHDSVGPLVAELRGLVQAARTAEEQYHNKAVLMERIAQAVQQAVKRKGIGPLKRCRQRKDYVTCGTIHSAMGRPDQAREAYKRAARRQRDSFWVQSGLIHVRIAWTYALQGRPTLATKALDRASKARRSALITDKITRLAAFLDDLDERILSSRQLRQAAHESPVDAQKHFEVMRFHSVEFPLPLVMRIEAERLRLGFKAHPKVLDGTVAWQIIRHRWALRDTKGLGKDLPLFEKKHPEAAAANAVLLQLMKAEVAFDVEQWQTAYKLFAAYRQTQPADPLVLDGTLERRIRHCRRELGLDGAAKP